MERAKSAAMAELVRRVEAAGEWTAPILVVGETGAGKELVARALHGSGPRRGGRFLAGKFRADLYYRLARLEIEVPPLRRRQEDLDDLSRHLLSLHAGRLGQEPRELTSAALAALRAHDWPGNVRELETTLVRLQMNASSAASVPGAEVDTLLCRLRPGSRFSRQLIAGRKLQELRDELARAYLLNLFEETEGSIPRMVEALEVPQASLYRWFRRLGIDVRRLRSALNQNRENRP